MVGKMKQGITVITPTGDRPEAITLLMNYVHRQTSPANQWIIIDDSVDINYVPWLTKYCQFCVSSLDVVKRERKQREPKHTLPLNLLEALPLVQYDTVLVMEDDDWYHPEYIAWMLSQFHATDKKLLGQGRCVYYHLPSQRYRKGNNIHHASLCQTGFKADMINNVKQWCEHFVQRKNTNPFIDLKLWTHTRKNLKRVLFNDTNYCVGIKGMPGRQGTCAGWTKYHTSGYATDKDGSFLYSLIGNDVELYKEVLESGRTDNEGPKRATA